MEQTLILNATYEPLKIVDWQRAVTLWVQGKVEIIEEHDRTVRAVKFEFKLPSVVRLLHFVKLRKRPVVQFTRANIYARDGYTCQYCDQAFEPEDLTFDHVIPVAQGGTRGWENIVTACEPCNKRKGARTPEEAGLVLKRQPRRPIVLPHNAHVKVAIGYRTPANWHSWLYWHTTLEGA
jgi:5-methylcytosine-specific restriction endonuclease McrA